MDKWTLKGRCKEAEVISKHLKGVQDRLNDIPSFRGKAAFIDRINRVSMEAHNLSWDLKRDLEDLR
jgi:hypothetical protein